MCHLGFLSAYIITFSFLLSREVIRLEHVTSGKKALQNFRIKTNVFGALLHIVQDFRKSFLRKGKSQQYHGPLVLDGISSVSVPPRSSTVVLT